MRKATPFLATVLSGLLLAAAAHAEKQTPKSAKRSTDSRPTSGSTNKGVTHYGDSVPAEYSQREQRVLNSQGLEVQKRQAEMSPAEAGGVRRQAERRSAPQAARHVPDLHLPVGQGNRERARHAARPDQRPDPRSRSLHRQPHYARRGTEAARAEFRALQHQARRAPHARRSRRGNGARHERAAHAEFRADTKRAASMQNVVDQFDADIKRFKELRTSAAARINQANRAKK